MNGSNEQKRRIGIYGGTFAPVHNGHVRAASAFLNEEQLDCLYVIPAGIPPHKQISWADSPQDRFRMLELAFSGCPEYGDRLRLSDYEIKNPGPSYTINTLHHYGEENTTLVLLCGTDMFLSLDTWRRAPEIMALADIVYARRENDPEVTEQIARKTVEYTEKYSARIRPLALSPYEISSQEIRERIGRGEDVGAFVPPAVGAYIRKKQLYHA